MADVLHKIKSIEISIKMRDKVIYKIYCTKIANNLKPASVFEFRQLLQIRQHTRKATVPKTISENSKKVNVWTRELELLDLNSCSGYEQ